jgi:hypothetical protein
MEILEGEWFRLPYVGTDDFKTLMSLGLKYDKSKGMLIDDGTNKKLLVMFLTEVLKEDVIIYKKCAICLKKVDCRTCEYNHKCDYYNSSTPCLCKDCLKSEENYASYIMSS